MKNKKYLFFFFTSISTKMHVNINAKQKLVKRHFVLRNLLWGYLTY